MRKKSGRCFQLEPALFSSMQDPVLGPPGLPSRGHHPSAAAAQALVREGARGTVAKQTR